MSIERDFFKFTDRHRRIIDDIFDSYEEDIRNLLSSNNRKVRNLYSGILKSLETYEDQRIKPTLLGNFTKLEKLRRGVLEFITILKKRIFYITQKGRDNLFYAVLDKEKNLEDILAKVGVNHPRSKVTVSEIAVLDRLFKRSVERINVAMEKWRRFSYDAFFAGISSGMTSIDLERSLFTEDGNIKIGSSLEYEVDYESSRTLMEQRTQYQIGRAEHLGYEACWNFNPLDQKTKAICMSATLAGVIPKDEMRADYGFPPRQICRCDLTFVGVDWVEFNQGINNVIEERRREAIGILESMPKQKTEWDVKSHIRSGEKIKKYHVETKDAERLAGKHYARTEERLNILKNNRVPKYKWTPPEGWKPPRDFRTLARLVDSDVIALGEEAIKLLKDVELKAFISGNLSRDEVEDIIVGRM